MAALKASPTGVTPHTMGSRFRSGWSHFSLTNPECQQSGFLNEWARSGLTPAAWKVCAGKSRNRVGPQVGSWLSAEEDAACPARSALLCAARVGRAGPGRAAGRRRPRGRHNPLSAAATAAAPPVEEAAASLLASDGDGSCALSTPARLGRAALKAASGARAAAAASSPPPPAHAPGGGGEARAAHPRRGGGIAGCRRCRCAEEGGGTGGRSALCAAQQ